jgi:hypothetical protein
MREGLGGATTAASAAYDGWAAYCLSPLAHFTSMMERLRGVGRP